MGIFLGFVVFVVVAVGLLVFIFVFLIFCIFGCFFVYLQKILIILWQKLVCPCSFFL